MSDILLNRSVDEDIKVILDTFICKYLEEGLSEKSTLILYNFILTSFKKKVNERYSVSQLAKVLKKHGIETKLLINIYYHALNCLAIQDGQKIYKGFIV